MKCVIVLALVAFTTATPLTGWGGVGIHPARNNQEHLNEVSQLVASQVTQAAINDQIAQTSEAIRNLQSQLQQYPSSWAGSYSGFAGQAAPSTAAEAINQLQYDMQYEKYQFAGVGGGHSQGSAVNQLYDTVQAGVEAQVTAGHTHYQKGTQGVNVPLVSGLFTNAFQPKIQKLIDEYNQQEMDNLMSSHYHRVRQLRLQQDFIAQQKQQIEAQQSILQQQGAPAEAQQLNQVYQNLQMQEYSLIQGQLAHQFAILQMQQALASKQQQVLQDTVSEQTQAFQPFGQKFQSF